MSSTREADQPDPKFRTVAASQLGEAVTRAHRLFLFDVITQRYVEVQRVSFMFALSRCDDATKRRIVSVCERGDDLFVSLAVDAGIATPDSADV